ncbi:MAG: hypothetical protein ABI669_06085 [Usitatibacter sp.]
MNFHLECARAGLFIAALALAGCGGGGGGGGSSTTTPPPPVAGAYLDATVYSSQPTAGLSNPNEITSVTHGQALIGATALNYTATTGHLTAPGLADNSPQASFFYVAYTMDGAAPATRPVTFFYNGGPGSSTIWLHLGSFGPKRLDTGEPNMSGMAPFPLVDNAESLLDVSDLVFVDAVGSGFSEAILPNVNRTFWGVDVDGAVFRDFIRRYIAVNNRASSPKFLYGESYGGPRTAVIADLLEASGTRLSGIVLQSPALNYNSNCGIIVAVVSCGGYLPTFGATAAWFGKASPPVSVAQIPEFMNQLRPLTDNEYSPAVVAFLTMATRPDPLLVTRLAAASGLTPAQWDANFNMSPEFFRVNLQPGTVSGRYDARVTLPNNSPPGREIDPSDVLISPSFSLRLGEYLVGPLGYTNPSTYTMLSNAINFWNFSHDGNPLPDTLPDLAAAIAQNPGLKVLAVNGYHDMATPFHTTERDLARLGSNPNVRVINYIGGHMTYLENSSRRAMKANLAQFYGSATQ